LRDPRQLTVLQWGRRHNAGYRSCVSMPLARSTMLQWGRRHNAGYRTSPRDSRSTSTSFNGAGDITPDIEPPTCARSPRPMRFNGAGDITPDIGCTRR